MTNLMMTGPHSPRLPSKLRITSGPSVEIPFLSTPTIGESRPRNRAAFVPPTPKLPPSWTWTCHQCHSSFLLGATRRCLNDGHRFCAGVTYRNGRPRRHRACGSTFDYVGWKKFSSWREDADRLSRLADAPTPRSFKLKILGLRKYSAPEASIREHLSENDEDLSPTSPKNCERQCSFPSECRWNPKPKKEEKKKAAKSDKADSPICPAAATIEPRILEDVKEPSPKVPQLSREFRAPVLDFAAFKARLDRASARRRHRDSPSKPQLPELKLGIPLLMDVDSISPTSQLPKNKRIHIGITREEGDEPSSDSHLSDMDMRDVWESDSSSEESSDGENAETQKVLGEVFVMETLSRTRSNGGNQKV